MQTYLVLGLVFAVGVAVFAVQNGFGVDINFFFWKLENVSLVVVIFGSALVGAAATALFGIVKQFKLSANIRKFKAEIDQLNTEIGLLDKKLAEVNPEPAKESQTLV